MPFLYPARSATKLTEVYAGLDPGCGNQPTPTGTPRGCAGETGIDLFWCRQQGLWAERAYYLGLGEWAALVDVQQGG